jgi:hypothetical protein
MAESNSKDVGGHELAHTIEDIERRAEEVEGAELEALHRVAELLRELAVELPHESKLPVSFANTAKRIEKYLTYTFHPSWAVRDLNTMVEDAGREGMERYTRQLEEFLGWEPR